MYIGIFIDGATYTLNLKNGVYWRRVTVIDCIAGAGAQEKTAEFDLRRRENMDSTLAQKLLIMIITCPVITSISFTEITTSYNALTIPR